MESSHIQMPEPEEQQGPSASSEIPLVSTTHNDELEMAQESQVPPDNSLHHDHDRDHDHHNHNHNHNHNQQHLHPEPQVTIMRTASSASLAPEACHVEDIDAGCKNHGSHQDSSILHSAVPTPATSRHPSAIGLNIHMVGREAQATEESSRVEEDGDEEDVGLEMKRAEAETNGVFGSRQGMDITGDQSGGSEVVEDGIVENGVVDVDAVEDGNVADDVVEDVVEGEVVEDDAARFEQGIPLAQPASTAQSEEIMEDKQNAASNLFDDVGGDDFFGGLGIKTEEAQPIFGEEVTAGLSTATSAAFDAPTTEEPSETATSPFEGVTPGSGAEDDFFSQIGQQAEPFEQMAPEEPPKKGDDVAELWKAALAGEGFLPSDDEGFLSDSDDEGTKPVQNVSPQPPASSETQPVYQPLVPPPAKAPAPSPSYLSPLGSPYAAFSGQQPPPQKKAESFVDKKSAYQSPYDLPMDVGLPVIRKRPSNLSQPPAGNAFGSSISSPPVRSNSAGPAFSPVVPSSGPPKPKPPMQEKFFEELPMAPPKPNRYAPASGSAGTVASPYGAATGRYSPAPSNIANMYQAPPRAPPTAPASPYTPAPVQAESAVKYAPRAPGPPQMVARTVTSYAPPPAPAQPLGFSSPPRNTLQQGFMTPQQMSPPHASGDDHGYLPRRFPGDHHVLHSSRPGTSKSMNLGAMDIPREEEEDGVLERPKPETSNGYPPLQPPTGVPPPLQAQNRYNLPPRTSTETPPPPMKAVAISRQNTYTPPPQRSQSPRFPMAVATQLPPQSNNVYPPRSASPETFQPPPRAQTQSPGMAYGRPGKMARANRDPYERPSSAFAHSGATMFSPVEQQRRTSLSLQFSPPANEEAARDELNRWQGAPVFKWGFGGNVVMTFPKRANRYTVDMAGPMTVCSPGEIKVKHIKDVIPLGEVIGKFPGPVWTGSKSTNKGKKKEVIAWMTERITEMERFAEENYDPEAKKVVEAKILLWKVVRIMVENDGVLEGNAEVEKAVRAVLNPEAVALENGGSESFTTVGDILAMQPANADTVDPQAVKNIRDKLLAGDKTGAIWHAVDKRLWSHALLISSAVGKDIWKQVVQEFVKNEVKTLGEGTESLAVLYEIFAGNPAESVDELVPQSARLGMPMMSSVAGDQKNVGERLDKWRETLGLVLSNRSVGDVEAIVALGRLLASYGRVEAAHICYLFSRQGAHGGVGAICGGPEEPSSDFTLLGIDHKSSPFELARDLDAVMLTEIYELALSLSPLATAAPVLPHLQNYKLHHAIVLAENGYKSEAMKYCDFIGSAIKAWNKPSPYFNERLFRNVDELMKRLQESPKDSGSSWIPTLNSDSVSSSVWAKFNKFVAGEEEENSSATALNRDPGMDASPFAKIASPEISRTQSAVDMYAAYSTSAGYQPTPANGSAITTSMYQPSSVTSTSTSAGNKYAPKNSHDSQRSPYDNHRSSSESYRPPGTAGSMYGYGGYEPTAPSGNPYEPANQRNSFDSPLNNSVPQYAPMTTKETPSAPASAGFVQTTGGYEPATFSSSGYEPPSAGGYEPPTSEFTPYEPEPEPESEKEEEKKNKDNGKKKKGIMDDDDEDEAFIKANMKVKEEEAKRKEEEEKKSAPEGKKGWFGGWFKKAEPTGPKQVKLGEESSFVYDPEQKRWVNKKARDTPAAAKPAPPPKRSSAPAGSFRAPSLPPSETNSPTTPFPTSTPPAPSPSAPPPVTAKLSAPPAPRATPSPGPVDNVLGRMSAPPSRPQTAMGGDAIDDLLGPPGGSRKATPAGRKGGRKSRYVEVIPGQQ
ncbi:vesicle coat component [Rhizina undulata]